jgi:hypothetical protein
MGEAVTDGSGFDDLPGEGETVDYGGAEHWVGESLVQPENGSLDAIAMADFSPLSVRTWKSSSAPRRSSSMYPSSSSYADIRIAVRLSSRAFAYVIEQGCCSCN